MSTRTNIGRAEIDKIATFYIHRTQKRRRWASLKGQKKLDEFVIKEKGKTEKEDAKKPPGRDIEVDEEDWYFFEGQFQDEYHWLYDDDWWLN